MKKIPLIIIHILSFIGLCKAQSNNLIWDPGFNLFNPGEAPQCICAPYDSLASVTRRMAYWRNADMTNAGIDAIRMVNCGTNNCAPNYTVGNFMQLLFHDDPPGDCDDCGGIRTGLKTNLIPGKTYILKLSMARDLKSGDPNGEHKVIFNFTKFSKHWAKWAQSRNAHLWDWDNSQGNYFTMPANGPSGWQEYAYEFTVPNNYDELGNFVIYVHRNGGKDANRSVLLDNVEVFEKCPNPLAIQNISYTYTQQISGTNYIYPYEAAFTLATGANVDANSQTGPVIITSNAVVVDKAGGMVYIEPGFKTMNGGKFRAYIQPCGEDCSTPNPSVASSFSICNNTPVSIGGSSQIGITYNWTSVPSMYASPPYLNNSSISNPLFTAPPEGRGTIVYTMTATNTCGQVVTKTVIISYDNNPDPNPSLIINSTNSNDPSADFPIINVTVGDHTEYVKVEVLDQNNNPILDKHGNPIIVTLYKGQYFSSSTFDITLNDLDYSFCACNAYKLKFTTKNNCSSNTDIQFSNWNVQSGIRDIWSNNVMFKDDNGYGNSHFCFRAKGATDYEVLIYISGGTYAVYHSSGKICNEEVCTWDGYSTNGFPGAPYTFTDGEYYALVTFKNSCTHQSLDYTTTITLFGSQASKSSDSINIKPKKSDVSDLTVNPLPFTNNVNLTYKILQETPVSIIINNIDGKEMKSFNIKQNNIGEHTIQWDASAFPAGVYYYTLKTNLSQYSGKLIKVK